MPRNLVCPKCREKPKHCKCSLLMEIKNLCYALKEIKEELEYDISNGKVALDIATDSLTE